MLSEMATLQQVDVIWKHAMDGPSVVMTKLFGTWALVGVHRTIALAGRDF